MNRRVWTIKKRPIYSYGIVFFLYVLGSFAVPMLGWNGIFLQGPLYLFLLLCIIGLITRRIYVDSSFVCWYGTFFCFCLISMIYSVSLESSLEMFSELFTALILSVCLNAFFYIVGSDIVVKYSYIIVSIIIGIRLITTFSQQHWWSRLGESFGMNENMVGLYFLIPLCFAITELSKKNKIYIKIINLLAVLVSGYVVMLSGSKKAIFAVAIFVSVYFLVQSNNIVSKFKAIIISIVVVVVVYKLLIEVPLLYNIAGKRIESMITVLQVKNYNSAGSSTSERGDMIRYALKCFINSPLLGHGINGFRVLYGKASGHYVYAHNNFVELLADLGIVGFSLYYFIYYKLIRRLLCIGKKYRKEFADCFAFIVVLLFYDIAMVSFYDTRILMLISFICVSITKKSRKEIRGGKLI